MDSLFIQDNDNDDVSCSEGNKVAGEVGKSATPFLEVEKDSVQDLAISKSNTDVGDDILEPLFIMDHDENKQEDAKEEEELELSEPVHVSLNLPLRYQQQITQELLKEDGLLLLARGLGINKIVANALHALSTPAIFHKKNHNDNNNKTNLSFFEIKKKSLILLLNAKDDETEYISSILNELSWIDNLYDPDLSFDELDTTENLKPYRKPHFRVLKGDSPTIAQRSKYYNEGGIISITSRVLIVDMLSHIIDINTITGIFIVRAENVSINSNESFILKLFRETNKWGFIKAVSEEIERFSRGFDPLTKKLKLLKVNKVFLWPRFHIEVTNSLYNINNSNNNNKKDSSANSTSVIEINVELTDLMKEIQTAILQCIEASISELKKLNQSLNIDMEDWNVDNFLNDNFIQMIRTQLDPQWHRISSSSKQLVTDLSTLRYLLNDLPTDNCISFYRSIQNMIDEAKEKKKSTNDLPSLFLLDAFSTLVSKSRDRVYTLKNNIKRINEGDVEINTKKQNIKNVINDDRIVAVLEEQPKWEQLAFILDEIASEQERQPQSISNNLGPILIMCSSHYVSKDIQFFLSTMKEDNTLKSEINGLQGKHYFSSKMMVNKLKQYFKWRQSMSKATPHFRKPVDPSSLPSSSGNVTHTGEHSRSANDSSSANPPSNSNNRDILLRNTRRPFYNKRRRTRGGSTAVSSSDRAQLLTENISKEDKDIEFLLEITNELPSEEEEDDDDNEDDVVELSDTNEDIEVDKESPIFRNSDRNNQIIVKPYNIELDDSFLEEIMPSYIIMFEPNTAFIRRVEVYQSIYNNIYSKTYFMYYGNSTEEQKYLTSVRREKDSFTRLIKEKATIPLDFTTEDDSSIKFRRSRNINTRIAGGSGSISNNKSLVIVDTREFSSSLPSLIYSAGMTVVPCMLTVGDYIISPKICIERKSVSDLIGSFKDGRLYSQCLSMQRHYEIPTLLIEFDETKSFSLEPFSESHSASIATVLKRSTPKFLQDDIQTKLTLLLLQFPNLKIIWSSSPQQTAEIFMELKSNQEEPNIDIAIKYGANNDDFENYNTPIYNHSAIDMIQQIPGINSTNYSYIIQNVKNIQELAEMSKEDLSKLIGKEAANKAYHFLNENVLS